MQYLSFDVGIKNLAYCLINDERDILSWKKINLVPESTRNVKNMSTAKIIDTLILKLETIDKKESYDVVLIENQPALKNPKMKAIASTIYAFFKIQGAETHFISPSRKLKGAAKMNYAQRKTKAVDKTKGLIKNTDWFTFFMANKKKDDLADCYLQALAFLVQP